MIWQNNERVGNRGTILVASNHAVFADIVGEMVATCGFAPAYSAGQEASWLALTRTQPCIVICDCSAPADGIQRLIVDASARHIPLILSDARMQQRVDEGSLLLPPQVAWLTFPISRDAFARDARRAAAIARRRRATRDRGRRRGTDTIRRQRPRATVGSRSTGTADFTPVGGNDGSPSQRSSGEPHHFGAHRRARSAVGDCHRTHGSTDLRSIPSARRVDVCGR